MFLYTFKPHGVTLNGGGKANVRFRCLVLFFEKLLCLYRCRHAQLLYIFELYLDTRSECTRYEMK